MTWAESANVVGIVPAVALMIVSAGGWAIPSHYILVAMGLGLSAAADWAQAHTGGSGVVGFYFLPWQIAFVLWGLVVGSRAAAWVLPALVGLLGLSVLSAAASEPARLDWMVTLVGSVVLCVVAWRRDVLVTPVLLYFGIGSVCYMMIVLMLARGEIDAVKGWWFAYQGARLAAALAFTTLVVRERWWMHT